MGYAARPSPCHHPDGVDGKRRRVARGAQAHESAVGRDVIHAIRYGSPERVVRIVVHIDGSWLAHPGLASVLEVAHEFFFLVSTLTIGRRPR